MHQRANGVLLPWHHNTSLVLGFWHTLAFPEQQHTGDCMLLFRCCCPATRSTASLSPHHSALLLHVAWLPQLMLSLHPTQPCSSMCCCWPCRVGSHHHLCCYCCWELPCGCCLSSLVAFIAVFLNHDLVGHWSPRPYLIAQVLILYQLVKILFPVCSILLQLLKVF